MNNCNNCRFSVSVDYGYSNYTVEGTDNYCGSPIDSVRNQFVSFDNFYGKAPEMTKYDNCVGHESGDGINIDVEGDDIATLTVEEKEIYERSQS